MNIVRYFLILICMTLIGCTSQQQYVEMRVKAYQDPDVDARQYKTFDIIPVDSIDPLLEKQLLYLFKDSLEAKGLVRDTVSPQFLIAISHFCGPFDKYIPPSIRYIPTYSSGSTIKFSGRFGFDRFSGKVTESGKWGVKPVTTGGRTITLYFRHLGVWFIDVDKVSESEDVPLMWRGEAASSGTTSDIFLIAPYLINELLGEFPNSSGKSDFRKLPSNIGKK